MSKRSCILEEHHKALGALPNSGPGKGLDEWNDMLVPWTYATNPGDELDSLRDVAAFFDISSLTKIHVRGKGAIPLVDHCFTRDMTMVYPGRSVYGLVLTEEGTIGEDVIAAVKSDEDVFVMSGTGDALDTLQQNARNFDATVETDDDLHVIVVCGPMSAEFLTEHTDYDLPSLKYFDHAKMSLFGSSYWISRTGNSGERSYEIFGGEKETIDLWENLISHGKKSGIVPMSITCLNKARIEAALHFYPFDMSKENTPWELGLGWTVSPNGSYIGKDACFSKKGKETIKYCGIVVDLDRPVAIDAKLLISGETVGIVTTAEFSNRMDKSLALVHLSLAASTPGTKLEVEEPDGIATTATVEPIPFYDPEKKRTHA